MTPFRASLLTLVAAASLTAVAAGAQTSGAPAASSAPEPPKQMQRWSEDHAAMLDARLAGLKAGLRLTPDQEKLWAPFEAAVRDFARTRMARMQAMMERARKDEESSAGGPPLSPIDRLDMLATRLSNAGAGLKTIADAAKPLYASLDDQQKRMFGFLSHEMMMMGRERHDMGPMGGDMGPMGHHEMGMGMGPMGHRHGWWDQDEDEGDGD